MIKIRSFSSPSKVLYHIERKEPFGFQNGRTGFVEWGIKKKYLYRITKRGAEWTGCQVNAMEELHNGSKRKI